MKRALLVLAGATAIAACGDDYYIQVGMAPGSNSGIPSFQQVGDSVHLYATEWRQPFLAGPDPAIPSSDREPDLYSWTSSDPGVLEMRPTGWMVLRAPGEATVSVKGGRSRLSQAVKVCARDTRLEIRPRDPTLQIGDTLAVVFAMAQPDGKECGWVGLAPFDLAVGGPGGPLDGLLNQPNRRRAARSGSAWYKSEFSLGIHMFRDSIFVTVK